ncbi:hypothetical protein HMPREF0281_02113 [Corynebacterium ammoniagenes DSM 20306]|uniref:Uncharacterized protein n=1 Tax=Corynebacterium ammoniagenes DSM 20306 TaxID=649754 RepID=A0ABN0ADH2_CORAM|nr:hypothetical protein HMPREF0281_02113 [Corynebacterium ammoniagenes DSM 20306]
MQALLEDSPFKIKRKELNEQDFEDLNVRSTLPHFIHTFWF